MLNWLYIILITLLPAIELRGSIPVGILLGLDIPTVFLVATVVNILLIPVAFVFLDVFWDVMHKFSWFKRYVEKKKKKVNAASFTGLLFFVAIPLPGTGAYTGALITKLFNLDKKTSFVAIALGVACAGLLVTLITTGILEIFSWMI